ncbi:hypothetical protein FGO68_gene14019 [Halteria grandinella]|uniref:Uncharacterized protein n=1 Tax=Halteria grandinella TaxID=5974 RepID=A0A8J8NKG2_HALGN|nr:hypothetical protein FGO68_gene14019 [Halteria grandinella]
MRPLGFYSKQPSLILIIILLCSIKRQEMAGTHLIFIEKWMDLAIHTYSISLKLLKEERQALLLQLGGVTIKG